MCTWPGFVGIYILKKEKLSKFLLQYVTCCVYVRASMLTSLTSA